MANKKIFAGMLAIALVFGMAVVSCDDDTGGGADPALNGTWANLSLGRELIIDNGKYELSSGGKKAEKGTYVTAGKTITIGVTHMYGTPLGLGEEWYTKDQIKAAFGGMADEKYLNQIFATQAGTYSVTDTTLDLETTRYGAATFARVR